MYFAKVNIYFGIRNERLGYEYVYYDYYVCLLIKETIKKKK